ncbi:hypothetical protein HQ563_11905 [bacterium]|nr:hypothetical protein [bacterium]
MAPKGASKREQLFTLYATNLSIYHPDVVDHFLCPLCLNLFSRAALRCDPPNVALAHVVPQSVGGRLCTLACRECDNRIGSAYDSHANREKSFVDWQRGTGTMPGRLKHKRGDIGVEMSLKDNGKGFQFLFIKGQWDPASISQFVEDAESDWSSLASSFTFRAYNSTKRDKSLLYSAFLMMFQEFGYEYVLSPNAHRVRQVIRDNRPLSDLGNRVFSLPEALSEFGRLPSVSILIEPRKFRSFIVALPSPKENEPARCLFLPGFGEDGKKAYECLLALAKPCDKFRARVLAHDLSHRLPLSQHKWFANRLWRNLR